MAELEKVTQEIPLFQIDDRGANSGDLEAGNVQEPRVRSWSTGRTSLQNAHGTAQGGFERGVEVMKKAGRNVHLIIRGKPLRPRVKPLDLLAGGGSEVGS
jgi:hypothetical protein